MCLTSQLYFETSKFGKNSRTFQEFVNPGFLKMSTPTQVGISRGMSQYGGRRCLKVKGCFFVLQKLLLVRYCLPRYPLLNLLIFSPQSGASYYMLREEKNHVFNRTSICTINAFMLSCPSEKKKQQQRNKEKTHSTIMF